VTFAIEISEAELAQLRQRAKRLGVSAEDLVRQLVAQHLRAPESDFEELARHILDKNHELYRRLA
jgi:hypothetical protein